MENNVMEIVPQNSTEYKPTNKERSLLEVMVNPEHRMKSVAEWCRVAGCDRTIYYLAVQKPGFMAIYEQNSKDLVKQALAPVINSTIREAIRGSAPHAKMILEMAGVYSEKSTVDLNVDITLSADDRRARIAELLQKPVIEGLRADYKLLPDTGQDE